MSKQPFYRVLTAIILVMSAAALALLFWNRGAKVPAVRINAAPAAVSPVSELHIGSRWYGTLQIEKLTGEGPLTEGSRTVWGSLDSSPDGTPYFELSEKQKPLKSDVPLLSFWCALAAFAAFSVFTDLLLYSSAIVFPSFILSLRQSAFQALP